MSTYSRDWLIRTIIGGLKGPARETAKLKLCKQSPAEMRRIWRAKMDHYRQRAQRRLT